MASQSEGIEIGTSKEIFMTGNHSLFLANPDSLNVNAGTWSQKYAGPMPAPGSSLELVAFVKGENIRRKYPNAPSVLVTFQLTPWPKGEASYKNSTNSSTDFFVEGDFDWTPIFVTIDNFPAEVDFIRVSLTTPRRGQEKSILMKLPSRQNKISTSPFHPVPTCHLPVLLIPQRKPR